MTSSGQYMCTAMNDVGSDSAACRVRVKREYMKNLNCLISPLMLPVCFVPEKILNIAPEFTSPLSDIKTKEGEDIRLQCVVTGTPTPRVQWCLNEEVRIFFFFMWRS